MSAICLTPPASTFGNKIQQFSDSNNLNSFSFCPNPITSKLSQVNVVVLRNIPNSANLGNVKPCQKLANSLSNSLMQLPIELTLKILLLLPDVHLLKIRQICNHYKTIIDTTSETQVKIVKIAHLYLQTIQPQCNIPTDDLKTGLKNHQLSVEVNNNLCLWKLTQDTYSTPPQLSWTIPWISHLIIKNGQPEELVKLFTKLHGNKRLSSLYLLNCNIASETSETVQSLPCPNIVMDSNHANEYSIEKFLATNLDLIVLKELKQQLQDESISGEQILNKIKELHPIIQEGIASSIWHSTLSTSTESIPLPSKEFIQQQVNSFILQEPYHSAVQVAVNNNLNRIS